jgi:hypothetical protein
MKKPFGRTWKVKIGFFIIFMKRWIEVAGRSPSGAGRALASFKVAKENHLRYG